MKKIILASAIALLSCSLLSQAKPSNGAFKVVGERVDYPIPTVAKLAYMVGSAKGEYLIEYIDKNDDVENWKNFLIGTQRLKGNFNSTVQRTLATLKKACPEIKTQFFKSETRPTSQYIVLRYFCPTAQPKAPHGEGAVMAFLAGKKFTFKIWSSWRPQSADLGKNGLGISNEKIGRFLVLSEYTKLCNPAVKKQQCQFNSLLPK